MGEFTKGPWVAIYEHDWHSGDQWGVKGVVPASHAITKANANLIAAAPDLLEALESCAGWLEWMDDPRCGFGKEHKAFIKQARAAIARARGEA